MTASRPSASEPSANSSIITSKVHLSPRSSQNAPLTSKGVAWKRFATGITSDGATKRKAAWGSMKRRISHGQAMRTIFGRARVTQTVRPWDGVTEFCPPG